ncbi:HNH endonuclease [Solilutibacter silvestris]|uniref:SMODS-associated and fused to various effectors domain-containing protein n=1 Tax=Solilutibacter silvestris TaxID=1645665 RepID=A0A2K1Q407_9GAMM|nr:SAVED domain-containing protein [Lysobacter silvestris]PNS09775.1 hypothetical protein Lysil_1404 [Lysobacter silvestris]
MPPKSPAQTKRAASRARNKRHDVPERVKLLVWIRAAGHCEQCGADLTVDLRSGRDVKLGDVAHIAPASPDGPRAFEDYTSEEAEHLSSDPENLLLLCPGDHRRTDRSPDAYPISDLRQHHLSHIAQIRHAAQRGETQRAQGLIILGQHWATENVIRPRDLQEAMLAEGLWAEVDPVVHVLPEPGRNGRDELYWQSVERSIDEQLEDRLTKRTSKAGDPLNLCVAGVADIPSLIRVGRQLGDRSNRFLYSRDRQYILRWPDPLAPPPEFLYVPPGDREGPIALVLSLSAEVPQRDVLAALPSSRIASFTTLQPRYDLLQSRAAIHAFRKELQVRLSQLEAESDQPIHVFTAIPAALAIEFGALLSTQHAHRYVIYDREGESNAFAVAMELGPRRAPTINQAA